MSANELLTAESPTKCQSWCSYSGGIKAISTMGHFMGLPKGEMGFDMETYKHKFIVEKKKVYNNLRKEARGKIVTICADDDREGFAIGYMTYLTIKDVAKEIYITSANEITPASVKKALESRIKITDFDKNFYYAFLGRRISDRLIGYTLSPMANKSLNAGLSKSDWIEYSAGRVQTVGVKLVYDKEMEIRKFIPTDFFSLSAFIGIDGQSVEIEHINDRFDKKDDVDSIMNSIQGFPAKISSVEKKDAKSKTISPFTTSTLQQDASSKLGFSVKKTMEIAQKLFEGIGGGSLITYHRTDKPILNDDFNNELRDHIAKKFGADKLPASMIKHENKNKNSQEGHEGIRPTDLNFNSSKLGADEKALYDLILSRTIASQMVSPIFKVTTISILIKDEKFEIKTKLCESRGYLDTYKIEIKKDEYILPNLNEGDEFPVEKLEVKPHKTQPPKRYTQSSLVKKLEEDGIGRPSTFETFISTILSRGYVKEVGKRKVKTLELTQIGEDLINWVKEEELASWILDYKFTAYLESELDKVQNGTKNYKELLKEVHSKMGFKKFEPKKQDFIQGKNCYCCGGRLVDAGAAFKCEHYKFNSAKGISEGCQFLVFKEPLGITKENLDDFINGKVFAVDGKYGKNDYHLDQKLLDSCKNGKKLKKGESLIVKKKDFIDGLICPICEGTLTKTQNQYACENVKTVSQKGKFKNIGSCTFKVNKKNDYVGYELNDSTMSTLIKEGELTLDDGKKILLDLENEYFIVDEAYIQRQKNIKLTGEKCPECGDDIVDVGKTYSCHKKKKKSCKFFLVKENSYYGYTIDIPLLKRVLSKEEINIGKNKKLVLDLDNKFYTNIY